MRAGQSRSAVRGEGEHGADDGAPAEPHEHFHVRSGHLPTARLCFSRGRRLRLRPRGLRPRKKPSLAWEDDSKLYPGKLETLTRCWVNVGPLS